MKVGDLVEPSNVALQIKWFKDTVMSSDRGKLLYGVILYKKHKKYKVAWFYKDGSYLYLEHFLYLNRYLKRLNIKS